MNDKAQNVTRSETTPAPGSAAEREMRAERILDAAAELLIAWGYRRVTIDEVARRAQVGKGTVYLHFRTKTVLFLTVLMRKQSEMIERLLDLIDADPATILPSRIARILYGWVHEEPLIRAVVLGDPDTLGTLARDAMEVAGDVQERRVSALTFHFDLLRDRGVLRTDVSRDQQVHAYTAVVVGFLTIDPLLPLKPLSFEAKADSLALTVRNALETDVPSADLTAVAAEVGRYYRELAAHVRAAVDKQTRI
ncbi:TetR/AcrR family transcriptional regulator [Nocardiopsis sediminis]|uniref:TetR/AcrR family transcriptional regulator n=1 Tax=Nocardiopsis sediminis TaxID=1778267 RepID=A0ABV8FH61_9ACTN